MHTHNAFIYIYMYMCVYIYVYIYVGSLLGSLLVVAFTNFPGLQGANKCSVRRLSMKLDDTLAFFWSKYRMACNIRTVHMVLQVVTLVLCKCTWIILLQATLAFWTSLQGPLLQRNMYRCFASCSRSLGSKPQCQFHDWSPFLSIFIKRERERERERRAGNVI